MPYIGQTYRVPLGLGVNYNPNYDELQPTALTAIDNINLHNGGLQPRGGCERIATSATSPIKGIAQYLPEDGTLGGSRFVDESANLFVDEYGDHLIDQTSDILTITADGEIYKNWATSLKTGLQANAKYITERFYSKVYIANGTDVPQVYDGGAYTYNMGSPKKCTAVLGTGAGNVDNGVHYYKITFTSASGESTVGVVSDAVTVVDKGTNGKVELSAIPLGHSSCTKRTVYRTKAGGTTYYKVADISDNTTTAYTDNTADAGISVEPPTTSKAFLPTDWVSGMPEGFIAHGRNNQKRLCAWGCNGYPNRLYMSENQEADFGDNVVTVITILCNRITGAIEFGENLIVFSDTKTFLIDDTDVTVANWGVQKATWEGGISNQDLIVKIPTDIIAMSPDGNIFSISASQKYGDFEIASISRPAYIHKFISDYVDLVQMSKFFAIYDPNLRAIKFFVVMKGDTSPDTCLIWFIDKGVDTGWSKHSFGINHFCSALIQTGESTWKIYTGGNTGYVYVLESDTLRDVSSIYNSSFTTIPLPLDNPRNTKIFDKVWVVMNPKGTETLAVDVDMDSRALATQYITMTAADTILQNFSALVGAKGQREQITITNSDGNNYFLSQLLIDFKDTGSI